MESTDEELWQAYVGGNSAALEALFARHKLRVFNFALRLLNSRADAEDVASEVFVQMVNKRFTPDGRAKLSTWMLTVARNASLSKLRSAKHMLSLWFQKDGGEDYEQWDVADSRSNAPEEIQQREKAKAVQKALQKLPVEQKEALILREYCQKNYEEIAQILGCSLAKVKVLIFRGREALRVELLPALGKDGL